jgi:transforming growth factor-beta-induced protein
MTQSKKQQTVIMAVAGMFIASILSIMAVIPVSAAKPDAAKAAKPGNMTITQIVVGNPNFDVLEAAVIKAGLAGALDGSRQYTVFAPTDQAFKDLFEVATDAEAIAIVESLPKEALTDILLYHVTSGRKISTSVLASPSQRVLNGDRLPLSEIADAGIYMTDVSARNGVVHIINSVLMP